MYDYYGYWVPDAMYGTLLPTSQVDKILLNFDQPVMHSAPQLMVTPSSVNLPKTQCYCVVWVHQVLLRKV